jgi:hypothetical protein
MKKTIVILLVLIVVVGIAYFLFNRKSLTSENSSPVVYSSESECEAATGLKCTFEMCDYVPEGKTFEEACGKNFKKGWVGMTTK